MRKTIFLSLLIFTATAGLSAQNSYTVKQMFFLPPTYYVGDLVELRVRVAADVVPTEPRELPEPGWSLIRDVRVIPISGEYDIRIAFSSYVSGSRTLPPIVLGDLILDDLRIDTESLLSEPLPKAETVFDPSYLPGSRLLLSLAVGLLLLVPLLSYFSVIWIRKLILKLHQIRTERRPLRNLTEILEELQAIPSPVNNRNFYIKLTGGFRHYLARKFGEEISSLTSEELENTLTARCPEVPELTQVAGELLRFDSIKFGGLKSTPARRGRDLSEVRAAATTLEEYLQRLRKQKRNEEAERADL
jgi:hypothetical protein